VARASSLRSGPSRNRFRNSTGSAAMKRCTYKKKGNCLVFDKRENRQKVEIESEKQSN